MGPLIDSIEGPTLNVDVTSPDAAGSAGYFVRFSPTPGFDADSIDVETTITGAFGGRLDILLQKQTGPNTWREICHLARAKASEPTTTITRTLRGDGLTGASLRIVFVAGSGTRRGTPQKIRIRPRMKAATQANPN